MKRYDPETGWERDDENPNVITVRNHHRVFPPEIAAGIMKSVKLMDEIWQKKKRG